jgi:hypothetical protein
MLRAAARTFGSMSRLSLVTVHRSVGTVTSTPNVSRRAGRRMATAIDRTPATCSSSLMAKPAALLLARVCKNGCLAVIVFAHTLAALVRVGLPRAHAAVPKVSSSPQAALVRSDSAPPSR